MPTIDELRARAAAHARQLEAVLWLKSSDLAARWGVDVDTVTALPRAELPYLEFGKSKTRRYNPDDVRAYEERAKQGTPGAAA